MIPAPPLTAAGELPETARADVLAALVPGLLSACAPCGHGTIWHWPHEGRYTPMHPHCVDKVIEVWGEMVADGPSAATPPSGRLTGAYARRAGRAVTRRPPSVSLGSPYFVPGMSQGQPWVAVALLATGGAPLVCPCGVNEAHARAVNERRRILAAKGCPVVDTRLALSGHVADPTGAISDVWSVE